MQDIRFDGKLDYIIDNIGYVNVLRNGNFIFPVKNGREKYILVFVENGEMNYFFCQTQKSITLVEGAFLFIPKHTPYVATYVKDNSIAKVTSFEIISDIIPPIFNAPIYKKEAIFSDIYRTLSGKDVNNITFLASKIYEILYTLEILEKENIVIPGKYTKIFPALNEIQKHYFENKNVSFYSDMCYMSESNFRKLFKEYTGHSPIEYRNIIRISKAKQMINSGEYTVCEAAYLTGFNNMSFFYEVCKKHIL